MSKAYGLVMATMIEASPFIKGLSMQKITAKPFPVYTVNNNKMIISGIGKVYASLAAAVLIREYGIDILVNAGAAGGLREGFETGDIFHVSEVVDYDRPKLINKEIRVIRPDIIQGYRNASLATLDRPVITPEDRKLVGEHADIIDMEGAGFLQACRVFGAKAYLWKIVSDTAEHSSDKEIISNIKMTIDQLYNFMAENVLIDLQ